MFNIGFTPIQQVHLVGISIEAQHREAHLTRNARSQGQAHISQTDDAHQGLFCLDLA